MCKIGFSRINRLGLLTILSATISVINGQSCNFDYHSLSRGSGSGFSNSGIRYKLPSKNKHECRCFHAETDGKSDDPCPYTNDPFSPLVDCAFLPREFIECAVPVDHDGNQTARDTLGHGCVKVLQYFIWLKINLLYKR